MARLGTVVRLAERRHRAAAGRSGPERCAVELTGLTVRLGGRSIVGPVDLDVGRGEWVGVIGANGAGKTTLLRAVAGLVDYEGDVRVSRRSAGAMGRRERARAVSYVPQSPELPGDMSVFDYVLLGRTPHIAYLAVESPRDTRRCRALLERLELAHLAGRHLSTLSGGERQRVVLARALAQEAPVLLMDEPTSALDMSHRVDALETVDELRRTWDLSVLSVLHDLTLAGQFADRLLLLSGGTVTALGRPAEVLSDPVLSAAFGPSVRIIRTADGDLVVAPRRTGPQGTRGPGHTRTGARSRPGDAPETGETARGEEATAEEEAR
jgi:iron complex transport system ATP-binding protein